MPGTGGCSRSVAGGASEKVPHRPCACAGSPVRRAPGPSSKDPPGAALTVRRCSMYCLSATSKPTAPRPAVPSCTRTTAWPGDCASGMPTTATQRSLDAQHQHAPILEGDPRRLVRAARGCAASATPPGHQLRCGSRGGRRSAPRRAPASAQPRLRTAARQPHAAGAAPHCWPAASFHSLSAGHAGAQDAARKPRLDLARRARPRPHRSARPVGARDDGEAARQGGQRAHRIEPALRQRQAMRDARQLCSRRG